MNLSLLSFITTLSWLLLLLCRWPDATTAFVPSPPPPPRTAARTHNRHSTFLSASAAFGSNSNDNDNDNSNNNDNNNDKFDLKKLNKRIAEINAAAGGLWEESAAITNSDDGDAQQQQHHQQHVTAHDDDDMKNESSSLSSSYYIILIEPGTAQQGVHTIEYPAGSGHNVVMAFASRQAAIKFANLLKQQQQQQQNDKSSSSSSSLFQNQQVVGMTLPELQVFCDQLGIWMQFVPIGMDLIPPRQNSDRFGHRDPKLREKQKHLEYLFAMEETEIEEQEGLLLKAVHVGVGSWD